MSLGQSKDGVFERNTWVFVLTTSWSRRAYIDNYIYIYIGRSYIYTVTCVYIKETSE